VRRKYALNKRYDTRAVEDVKLRRIFLEHLGKGELLDGASSVIGRIERDMSRCSVLLRRRFDCEESLGGLRGTDLGRP
jgi:hypothetical protein